MIPSKNMRIVLLALLLVFSIGLITLLNSSYALQYITDNETEFDTGVYDATFFNISTNATELNISETGSFGNYTSQIFDAGNDSIWGSISWIEGRPYGDELPDNEGVETVRGGVNMSGNVLLFHLNESPVDNGDSITDSSGQGNSGTLTTNNGAADKSADGIFNSSITFDGSGDYISANGVSADVAGSDFTAMAWIRSSVQTGQRFVLAFNTNTGGNRLLFGHRSNNPDLSLHDSAAGGWQDTSERIIDGDWHLIGFVFNDSNNTVYIYKDAEMIYTYTSTTTVASNDQFTVGMEYDNSNPGDYWSGEIDEVAIWDRDLTRDEIRAMYERGMSRLNVSVRSCDDAACSGETWQGPYSRVPSQLSVADNRYFQYYYNFSSFNETESKVELYNVTVEYELLDFIQPHIQLFSPLNDTDNTTSSIQDFKFNATDNNATTLSCNVWINATTSGTPSVIGTNNSVLNNTNTTIVSSSLSDDEYLWWVNCSDGRNWNISEKRLLNISLGDMQAPVVTALAPANNTVNTTSTTPRFDFNVSDDIAATLSCNLYLNETEGGTPTLYGQRSVPKNTSSNITANASIPNGDYVWWINCTDGNNFNTSVMRNITIFVDSLGPEVTLLTPTDQNDSIDFDSIDFTCRVTDDTGVVNVSLYHNAEGDFRLISTQAVSGVNVTANFSVDIRNGFEYINTNHTWNCLAYDAADRINVSPNNFSFSNWDLGNYTTTDVVYTDYALEISSGTAGVYDSRIFGGSNFSWDSIDIGIQQPYGAELPDNGFDERQNYPHGANMSGNVLLFHLNESPISNGGSIIDSSGSGNGGTLTTNNGAADKSAIGKFNGSINFDGSGDYITANSVTTDIAGADFTIMGWVRTSSTAQMFALSINPSSGSNRLMLGKASGNSNLQLFDQGAGGWQDSGDAFADGDWHLIGYTFSDSTNEVDVYLDGQVVDEFSSTSSVIASDLFSVGMEYDSGPSASDFWNGDIDEVAVWDRILNDSEIVDLYERGMIDINLSARVCDDAACSGESFTAIDNLSTTLSFDYEYYFQYRLEFGAHNTTASPQVFNSTVVYSNAPSQNSANLTNISVEKQITSIGSDMYLVRINVSNDIVNETNVTLYDFVDGVFVYGSSNPLPNATYDVAGQYNGTILAWNVTLSNASSREINYSFISAHGYSVLDNYIVGVEQR